MAIIGTCWVWVGDVVWDVETQIAGIIDPVCRRTSAVEQSIGNTVNGIHAIRLSAALIPSGSKWRLLVGWHSIDNIPSHANSDKGTIRVTAGASHLAARKYWSTSGILKQCQTNLQSFPLLTTQPEYAQQGSMESHAAISAAVALFVLTPQSHCSPASMIRLPQTGVRPLSEMTILNKQIMPPRDDIVKLVKH